MNDSPDLVESTPARKGVDMTPTPSEKVLRIVSELNLEPWQFFLGGSAALALRDLRDIGDLDIGVTTRYWVELADRREYDIWTPPSTDDVTRCDPPYLVTNVDGTEVNIFHSWRRRGPEETPFNDFNLVFRDGIEWVLGVPVIRLPILLRQKTDAVVNGIWGDGGSIRPKDITDIRLITDWMANGR